MVNFICTAIFSKTTECIDFIIYGYIFFYTVHVCIYIYGHPIMHYGQSSKLSTCHVCGPY